MFCINSNSKEVEPLLVSGQYSMNQAGCRAVTSTIPPPRQTATSLFRLGALFSEFQESPVGTVSIRSQATADARFTEPCNEMDRHNSARCHHCLLELSHLGKSQNVTIIITVHAEAGRDGRGPAGAARTRNSQPGYHEPRVSKEITIIK